MRIKYLTPERREGIKAALLSDIEKVLIKYGVGSIRLSMDIVRMKRVQPTPYWLIHNAKFRRDVRVKELKSNYDSQPINWSE